MRIPRPEAGLVFRYDYLWFRELDRGRSAGKDRPACLVATIDEESEPRFVVILPITHSQPESGVTAVEIPEQVRSHLGLDAMKSSVVISEYNVDRWPTPGMTSVAATGRFAYGILPPGLFSTIKEKFVDTVERGRAKAVRR